MLIEDKLQEYNQAKVALLNISIPLKVEFSKYIINKKIPLEQRWQVFIHADNDLKNHADISHAKGEGLKYFKKRLDCAEYGREKIYYFAEELKNCYKDGRFNVNGFINEKLDEDIAGEFMYDALEEILLKNWGSFEYDW